MAKNPPSKIIFLSPLLILIILVLFNFSKSTSQSEVPTPASTSVQKMDAKISNTNLKIEVVNTSKAMQIGLSKYTSLPENEGMLFVYETKKREVFWMKNMSFPIDIIWIADNTVVQISEKIEPEPGTPDNDLTLYPSNQPVNYVLEVNAGFVDKNNIKVGDSFAY